MNFWDFASGSPFLSFFLVALVATLLSEFWADYQRGLNVRKNGWPPDHCDSLGCRKKKPAVPAKPDEVWP